MSTTQTNAKTDPLRVTWKEGHPFPLHPEECEPHTPVPRGYIAWHAWAEQMGKTHYQRRCKGCGLYAIWEPRRAGFAGDQRRQRSGR